MTIRRFRCFAFLFLIVVSVYAQNESAAVPPRSFRGFSLGMNLDALKDALQKDELFSFRGDSDVSFLPQSEQNLVESAGTSFIKHASFQLRSGAVFVMTLNLNTQLVDYYSVFTSFTEKYGNPREMDPKQAIWESEDIRVSIERPLTVKYIDKRVFNELLDQSKALESKQTQLREDFLGEF
jgi:hypothetical protein